MMLTWMPLAMVMSGDALSATGEECAAHVLDREAWFEAAGEVITLPFQDLADQGVFFVTDEYADHGVLFTDGNDFVHVQGKGTYPNDGVGLNGFDSTITMEFHPPIYWAAVDLPECDPLILFSGGREILQTPVCFPGEFIGVGSTMPVDKVIVYDNAACPCIDDFHFSRTPVTIDCNGNGVADLIEVGYGCESAPDCNGNLIPDECDVASGVAEDCDANGVLDECETAQPHSVYEDFSPFGAPGATVIRFFDQPPAASDVLLTLSVSADLDESFEFIIFVSLDDVIMGEFFFVEDGLFCADPVQEVQLTVPAEQFNAFFEDNGRLDVDVKPTITVDADECLASFVGIRLDYLTFAEADLNYNGIPDACEGAPGDVDGDGDVDFTDLLTLLDTWGDCPPAEYCPADIDGSGSVGLSDLLLLLSNWS